MAAKRQKPEISDEQFKAVIEYLDQPKSTKKAACEMLGILYNTKRLGTLIDEWVEDQERSARLRKEKRKQPCTPEELVNIIEDYLDGATFDGLSKRFYRSTAYIKHRLELAGALIRVSGSVSPLNPPLLPDECVLLEETFRCRERVNLEVANEAEWVKKRTQVMIENGWKADDCIEVYNRAGKFDTKRSIDHKGEMVWLPAYQCLGEVVQEVKHRECKAFRVFLFKDDHHQFVNVAAWDIGSLRHLVELGVDVTRMGSFSRGTDCTSSLNKALAAARKNKDK